MPSRRLAQSPVLALCGFLLLFTGLPAQERSVKPGINKPFEKPNVAEFQAKFEKDGREPYDHRDKIVAACKLQPGMVVADVGAGTGLFTRLFAPAVGEKGKVFAVDIADEFIEHIERSARDQKLTNIEGVVCTSDSVCLPESSIDLAFICDVYHHFEFPFKTMRSVHDALKPGGRVVLIDFRRVEGKSSEWILNHVRAGQEVFEKEITESGFQRVEEISDLLKENYIVVFQKME